MYIQSIAKLNQGEINNLNGSILFNDVEVVIKKNFPNCFTRFVTGNYPGRRMLGVPTVKVAAFADPASITGDALLELSQEPVKALIIRNK